MKKQFKTIMFLLALLITTGVSQLSAYTHFNVFTRGEDNYLTYETDRYQLIYTPDSIDAAKMAAKNLDKFMKAYDKKFDWTYDEKLRLVLISNRWQEPNALAQSSPMVRAKLYSNGAPMMNHFNSPTWMHLLMVHELTHTYQLDIKKNAVSKYSHDIFGAGSNVFLLPGGIAPITINPNGLLPPFFHEGHAVFMESDPDIGGRLNSGHQRALKNVVVLDGGVTPTTVLHPDYEFPYGNMNYIVGGFFQLYLANKYGEKKVFEFWEKNSEKWLLPFWFNGKFRETFNGDDFDDVIEDFVAQTKKKAKNFKRTKMLSVKQGGIETTSSIAPSFLTRQGDMIRYVDGGNGYEYGNLVSYNTKTKKYNKEQYDLLLGRVFDIDGTIYSSTVSQINQDVKKAGLWDNWGDIKPGTEDKYINDIYKNKVAYIKVKDSSIAYKLYINDKYYADVASLSMFDKKGNIYYFSKINKNLVLFKNKKQLFKIGTLYVRLVDVVDNKVYFISSTKLGSGLFMWDNGKIYQIHEADDITDAKIVAKNKAMVEVVTSKGYVTGMTKISKIKKATFSVYKDLKNRQQFKMDKNFKNVDLSSSSTYYSPLNLKYVSTDLNMFGSTGVLTPPIKNAKPLDKNKYLNKKEGLSYQASFNIDVTFKDPLLESTLKASIARTTDAGEHDYTKATLSFANDAHIPFTVRAHYLAMDADDWKDAYRDFVSDISINYPFYLRNHFSIAANLAYTQPYRKIIKDGNVMGGFTFAYNRPVARTKTPYRSLSVALLGKADRGDTTTGVHAFGSTHLFGDTFLGVEGKYVKTNADLSKNHETGDDTYNLTDSEDRGIRVGAFLGSDLDVTNTKIAGMAQAGYFNEVSYGGVALTEEFYYANLLTPSPLFFSLETLSVFYNVYQLKRDAKYNIDNSDEQPVIDLETYGVKMGYKIAAGYRLKLPAIASYSYNSWNDEWVFESGLGFSF